MSLLAMIATGAGPERRNVVLPEPGPPIPTADRVDLDVLSNPASTSVIRGATMVPRGIVPIYGLTGGWSSWMWTQWPIETFIAPALDHMAANGCNTVAFKGGQAIYTDRTITWDEYLARWVDTINYAKELGMRVFACFSNGGTYPGSTAHDWNPAVNTVTNTSLIQDWAQAIASTENVIGVDVLNEVWIWQHTQDALTAYLNAVKGAGLPATYDWNFGGQSHLNPQTSFSPALASQFDYWCFHRYQDVTNTLVDEWRTANSALTGSATKRAFFGEYGAHTGMTTAARQSRYQSMKDLIDADSTMAGTAAFQWNDSPDDPSGNQLGMHTTDVSVPGAPVFTPRADVVDIWKTWPTRR